jgi:DNA-binding LytR/AlgR family response regulator
MIKALIVEDEPVAAEHLSEMIEKCDPEIEVVNILGSIKDTISWLQNNTADIIFLDIHLEDGLSFRIFEQVNIDTPIIFTTAYDKYAINAFSVNSIDYLLKPSNIDDLKKSINKFRKFGINKSFDINEIKKIFQPQSSYLKSFLVQYSSRIKKISVDEIAYFYAHDKAVYAVTKDDHKHLIDRTLDKLEDSISPDQFFRINRKLIVSESSILNMTAYSRSRIKLELKPVPPSEVEAIVSIERSQNFRKWVTGE